MRIADLLIALASIPRGGFRWWHGGRRLTGACLLSDFLPRCRGLLPWPPTTYPSYGGILIASETDPYLLLRCTVPWPASSDSLSFHVWGWFSPIFMWWLSQPSLSKLYTYNPCSTLSQCLPSNSYRSPFKIKLKVHPITLLLKTQSRDCLTARLWA
jgi:hypothetical protein